MRKILMAMVSLIAFAHASLCAQDLRGQWQGTLDLGPQRLRVVMRIAKADSGGWSATYLSLDESGFDNGVRASSVTSQRSAIRLVFDHIGATYNGTIEPDGNSIRGTWTRNTWTRRGPFTLDLERVSGPAAWRGAARPKKLLVAVQHDVALEVLDWGGTGRPVMLLAGLGNTAGDFDDFAQSLVGDYHVYGITRRGFGASSAPASGYDADRLGDDVLAVADSLGLRKPVLVGHSIAGEELSSVGSRYPERVSGLVYLDAGYAYAYYDSTHTVEAVLRSVGRPNTPVPGRAPAMRPPFKSIMEAIIGGEKQYTSIRAPTLAIFAVWHAGVPPLGAVDSLVRTAVADAFERGVPTARVVRLRNSDHFVFKSNEADVLREMRAFIDRLPLDP